MARTVVGLFKSFDEAQNVKHDLVNEGYSAEDIRVVDRDGTAHPPGAAVSTANESTATGFGTTISNFFRSFTGADPEDEKHYTEGVSTGGAFLAVTVPDDRADAAAGVLERHGAKNVDEQSASSEMARAKTPAKPALRDSNTGQRLDVVEEELQVGKRQVQHGGVRVYSHVTERPVEENITLREEHVRVERRPVDRAATEADFDAFKEGTIELTESAEEAVVSKKSRVVEEVVVAKDVSERQQTVTDTVRRSDVKVEKIGAERLGQTAEHTDFEPSFRTHFETNYAHNGSSYERYAPAYEYGYKLASNPRYANTDWTAVESSARSDWSKQGSGTWEDMKAAVRHGWDKVRSGSTTNS